MIEVINILKYIFLGASFGTLFFSLIFLLFPDFYIRIENTVSMELFESNTFFTGLEGKINFLNDWIFANRLIFGILFVALSIYNIKSLIAL